MWRFAPDLDPTTPEVYVSMSRMIPTPWGSYRTSPNFADGNSGSFVIASNTPTGSAILVKTDGTTRWFVGTTTKIYESTAADTTWTDVKSGAYSSSTTGWQFAQYGNITVATNKTDAVQQVNGASGTAFAALGGSPPKAALVCVQNLAVVLANYNDGTDTPDGWWASDIGSATTWTPASTNQAANGRLLQTPGAITAVITFGDTVIAFKESSVYRGRYVGRPLIWQWELIHPTIGTSSPNGVATDGKVLFFWGVNGAYLFDGAQFTRIDQGIDKYLRALVSTTACQVVWSGKEQLFVMYVSSTPSTALEYFAYCPVTGLWGVGTDEDTASASTHQSVVKVPASYDRYSMRMDATFVFGEKMTGIVYATQKTSVTTGWIGQDEILTNVTDVIPLYVPAGDYSYDNGATKGTLTHKTCSIRGGNMASVVGSPFAINIATGRFNVNQSARWHEFTFDSGPSAPNYTGMEITGIKLLPPKPAGKF